MVWLGVILIVIPNILKLVSWLILRPRIIPPFEVMG